MGVDVGDVYVALYSYLGLDMTLGFLSFLHSPKPRRDFNLDKEIGYI